MINLFELARKNTLRCDLFLLVNHLVKKGRQILNEVYSNSLGDVPGSESNASEDLQIAIKIIIRIVNVKCDCKY